MKAQFTFEQPHLILVLMGLKCMQDKFLTSLRNRYLDGEISEPEFNGMVETYRQLVSSVESCIDPGTATRWMVN